MAQGNTKISKNELKKLYWECNLSTIQIASNFGCTKTTVLRRMRKYGIPRRNLSEAHLKRSISISQEHLKKLYCHDKLSTFEIAKKIGVSQPYIRRLLKKHGIKLRRAGVQRRFDDHVSKQALETLYWDQGYSAPKIGELYGFTTCTVTYWMKKFGIPLRNPSQAHKGKPSPRKGVSLSVQTRQKISKALKGSDKLQYWRGKKFSAEHRKKLSESHKGQIPWMKGKNHTEEAKEKIRLKQLELLKNPEYLKKILSCAKPNKAEIKLSKLIQGYGFKYVGDGKLVLGGKCPDFVNRERNKIIELFGEYWHQPEEEDERIAHFKNFGYDALIVWNRELRNEQNLVHRIESFVKGI